MTRILLFLSAALLFFSCAATRPAVAPPVATPTPVAEKKVESPNPVEKPATPADELLLRDPATGAVSSLAELAAGGPALIDLSASWCEPCVALTERLNTLQQKFAGRIRFFMVLQKGDAPDRLPGLPEYPVYQLERAPAPLGITPPQILPTVLVFGADGTVAAELEGLYPGLYYYGVIADVTAGN